MENYDWSKLLWLAIGIFYWLMQNSSRSETAETTAAEPAAPLAPTAAPADEWGTIQEVWEDYLPLRSTNTSPVVPVAAPNISVAPIAVAKRLPTKRKNITKLFRRYPGWRRAIVMEALLQQKS